MKNIILALIIVFVTNFCFAEANLKSPKNTLITFRSAMDKVQFGDDELIGRVFNCLELPPEIPPYYKQTYLLSAAQRLQTKLESLDYMEDDVVCKTNGNKAEITLGFGKNTYTFVLTKDKDKNWRFSTETLDKPDLIDFYKKRKARLQKLTRKDMEGDTFVPELMSPANTLQTFKLGMEKCRGFNINDALETMNMSEISPLIHNSYGKIIAVNLYRILENNDCFELSSLSTDPLSPSPQVILFKPNTGTVMMKVYDNAETGLKSWQFTPRTLAIISKLYDSFASKALKSNPEIFNDDGINKKYVSSHFIIDDFIQKHFVFLEKVYLNMNLWKWILLIIAILVIPLIVLILKLILKPLIRLVLRLGTNIRHIRLEHAFVYPLMLLIIAEILYLAFLTIEIAPNYLAFYVYLFNFVEIITTSWLLIVLSETIGQIIIDKFVKKYVTEQNLLINMLIKVAKVIILVVGAIRLAEFFGISSMKVFAALSAVGIALALAGKETVQNVFGTIMLMLERPFKHGDYIAMNSIEGIIEHVGFRSTKVRTFYDSIVTVPNAQFITHPLENKGVRRTRRFQTTLSIAYDTPPDKIIAFTAAIRKIVQTDPEISKDIYRIRLYDMGASSLDILVYIFFITTSINREVELHEKFLVDVLRVAEKLGVEFAFPTRTIYTRPDKMPEHIPFGTDKEAEEKGCKAAEEVIAENNLKKED